MSRAKLPKRKQNPRLGVSPDGTLLEFVADFSGDFGFAYERFLNFVKDSHAHERFVFCAARGACTFKVRELKSGKTFTNSRDTSVFKAPNSLHSLNCDQTVYENLVFLPTSDRLRSVFEERGYSASQWTAINSGIREINRSPWFNALVERYFHQRLFSPVDRSSLKFLEDEILREILVLVLGQPSKNSKAMAASASETYSNPIRHAVETIELSLFSKIQIDEVAKHAGLSRASLMRGFQREIKMSPMSYVRKRRLEEAQRLLGKKTHSITEVSYLVGYEDTSAFCRAYRAQYGVSPKTASPI